MDKYIQNTEHMIVFASSSSGSRYAFRNVLVLSYIHGEFALRQSVPYTSADKHYDADELARRCLGSPSISTSLLLLLCLRNVFGTNEKNKVDVDMNMTAQHLND